MGGSDAAPAEPGGASGTTAKPPGACRCLSVRITRLLGGHFQLMEPLDTLSFQDVQSEAELPVRLVPNAKIAGGDIVLQVRADAWRLHQSDNGRAVLHLVLGIGNESNPRNGCEAA